MRRPGAATWRAFLFLDGGKCGASFCARAALVAWLMRWGREGRDATDGHMGGEGGRVSASRGRRRGKSGGGCAKDVGGAGCFPVGYWPLLALAAARDPATPRQSPADGLVTIVLIGIARVLMQRPLWSIISDGTGTGGGGGRYGCTLPVHFLAAQSLIVQRRTVDSEQRTAARPWQEPLPFLLSKGSRFCVFRNLTDLTLPASAVPLI